MPDAVNRHLGKPTHGECVRLERVARGMNQREFARACRLTRAQLQYQEGGFAPEKAALTLIFCQAPVGAPTRPQQCLLARWRSRTPTTDLAASLGVCRVTLGRMEARADPRLVALWRKRGFRFSQ